MSQLASYSSETSGESAKTKVKPESRKVKVKPGRMAARPLLTQMLINDDDEDEGEEDELVTDTKIVSIFLR